MSIESLEDFRKHYRHTYVFLEIDNKKYLVSYESDNGDDFVFESKQFGSIIVKEKTAQEKISFYFPKAGLYNINGLGPVDISRLPARQWKRAPCVDNVRLVSIHKKLITFDSRWISFTTNVAHDIFFPKYPGNTIEALNKIPEKGIAINSYLGVTKAPEKYKGNFILWYRQAAIGLINPELKEITVKYAPLYQEICDHYNKKEPEWKIHLKN